MMVWLPLLTVTVRATEGVLFPCGLAVIIAVPAPLMVAVAPTIEITFVLLLVKATAPPGALALSAKVPLGTKVCTAGWAKVMV